MELRSLVEMVVADDVIGNLINNPMAQFGPKNRQYKGPTLLPERNVPQNAYMEEEIRFRTQMANAGTRYSPPQLKGNTLVGKMFVELAESDIAAEFTAQDYDTIIAILERVPEVTNLAQVPPQAMTTLLKWADTGIVRPLLEFNEKCRWQALEDAQVVLTGDNGFTETVSYSNPSGHRVNAGGTWSDNNYDPYPDIVAGVKKLKDKGYEVARFITSYTVLSKLLNNAKILQRLGILSIAGGIVVGLAGAATQEQLNQRLAADGMPPIETYDLQYNTQTGTQYFLSRDVFIMVSTTERDELIDRGDNDILSFNTLGYTAIGRPANRQSQGRAYKIEYNDGKGSAVQGQGWQTSLPVVTSPEAVYVIGNIA